MTTTTRSRPPGLQEESAELGDLPPVESAPAPKTISAPEALRVLPRLVEEAREASGGERAERTARLNVHLEALASEGGSREVADVLLRLLESRQLEGLAEAEGRTSWNVAVETLTHLGFPYALEVRPEDLEHLRDQTGRAGEGGLIPRLMVAVAMVLSFASPVLLLVLLRLSSTLSSELGPLVALGGLGLMGMVLALLAPEHSLSRKTGVGFMLVMSLLQLVVGGLAEGHYGLVTGGASLLACLLLLLPRR